MNDYTINTTPSPEISGDRLAFRIASRRRSLGAKLYRTVQDAARDVTEAYDRHVAASTPGTEGQDTQAILACLRVAAEIADALRAQAERDGDGAWEAMERDGVAPQLSGTSPQKTSEASHEPTGAPPRCRPPVSPQSRP